MTELSRMQAITEATLGVLRSASRPITLDELERKVARVAPVREVSALEVCEGVGRLIDRQVAAFTTDRRVKTLRSKLRQLEAEAARCFDD